MPHKRKPRRRTTGSLHINLETLPDCLVQVVCEWLGPLDAVGLPLCRRWHQCAWSVLNRHVSRLSLGQLPRLGPDVQSAFAYAFDTCKRSWQPDGLFDALAASYIDDHTVCEKMVRWLVWHGRVPAQHVVDPCGRTGANGYDYGYGYDYQGWVTTNDGRAHHRHGRILNPVSQRFECLVPFSFFGYTSLLTGCVVLPIDAYRGPNMGFVVHARTDSAPSYVHNKPYSWIWVQRCVQRKGAPKLQHNRLGVVLP
jgi:hypothetical protein